jgi:hypothetical protein
MAAALDTLEISKRLRNAGFTEPQAEAVTGVLRDAHDADMSQLATKADLAQFGAELSQLRSEISQLPTKAEIGMVRSAMEILQRDLTIRLGSMIVVTTGVLLAAKFFG